MSFQKQSSNGTPLPLYGPVKYKVYAASKSGEGIRITIPQEYRNSSGIRAGDDVVEIWNTREPGPLIIQSESQARQILKFPVNPVSDEISLPFLRKILVEHGLPSQLLRRVFQLSVRACFKKCDQRIIVLFNGEEERRLVTDFYGMVAPLLQTEIPDLLTLKELKGAPLEKYLQERATQVLRQVPLEAGKVASKSSRALLIEVNDTADQRDPAAVTVSLIDSMLETFRLFTGYLESFSDDDLNGLITSETANDAKTSLGSRRIAILNGAGWFIGLHNGSIPSNLDKLFTMTENNVDAILDIAKQLSAATDRESLRSGIGKIMEQLCSDYAKIRGVYEHCIKNQSVSNRWLPAGLGATYEFAQSAPKEYFKAMGLDALKSLDSAMLTHLGRIFRLTRNIALWTFMFDRGSQVSDYQT